MNITVTIDAGSRQMLLLALAKLSIERPGWHWTLGELAAKFSSAPTIEDGRELFEQFREIHESDPLIPALEWQPIATAPQEQRVLVVLKPYPLQGTGEIVFGYFVRALPDQPKGVWTNDDTGEAIVPTHWIPMPASPPSAAASDPHADPSGKPSTRVSNSSSSSS